RRRKAGRGEGQRGRDDRRRGDHGRHTDRLLATRVAELGAADRDRLDHCRSGRARSMERIARMRIRDLEILDLRFPTSRTPAGTHAVHLDPHYPPAYMVLFTDTALQGDGLTFTLGRGTEVVVAAIDAFQPLVVGRELAEITADFGAFWHRLASESQLRWLGPEKGVIHLALAAIVNAIWDLWAK